MPDWPDMERLRSLAGKARSGSITGDEQAEVRALIVAQVPQATVLGWPDLLDVAHVWLGVYHLAKRAGQPAAASAS